MKTKIKKGLVNVPKRKKLSLQSTIIVVVTAATLVSLVVSAVLIRNYVIAKEFENTKEKIANIANLAAESSIVKDGLLGLVEQDEVQNYAQMVVDTTNVDFVVVLDTNMIRLSHPDETVIGETFSNVKDAKKALSGKSHYSEQIGVLGDGYRYFTPVFNSSGEVIGVVCVGLTMDTINRDVSDAQWKILVGLGLGLIVGVIGAIFLAQKIKSILFGLEPSEIATRLSEKEIIENEVSEGILAISSNQEIVLVNREAIKMFAQSDIQQEIKLGVHLDEVLYSVLFEQVFETKEKLKDQALYLSGIEVIASVAPIFIEGDFAGAVATFRDQSEMQNLIHELSGTEQYIDSMRAQTHEFMNKMHVILGLIELEKYSEVTSFIRQLNNDYQEEVGYITEKIKVPAIAGFLLGKINEAKEQGVEIILEEQSFLPELKTGKSIHLLLQIMGNLLDNAKEAVAHTLDKRVTLLVSYDLEGQILIIKVTDSGQGIAADIQAKMFERGFSTKGEHRGYGLNLIQTIVTNHQGFIEVKSQQNQGTTFYIELPYEMEEAT
ncbi:ATP-binding protein [Carnobacterium maltaromaticum]|uniref:ATP-binding protein n=1 Tax=Carnobacterium maltaromaticum TaxID=2751 RepID=UPI000704D668|nr:ATP-binding protein [Carnobacterium maltaromaticum]KRN86315.1 histidine protein kinase sensor protein [Carnobacterium maltaromaticum]